jgi:hypothetical protein
MKMWQFHIDAVRVQNETFSLSLSVESLSNRSLIAPTRTFAVAAHKKGSQHTHHSRDTVSCCRFFLIIFGRVTSGMKRNCELFDRARDEGFWVKFCLQLLNFFIRSRSVHLREFFINFQNAKATLALTLACTHSQFHALAKFIRSPHMYVMPLHNL